VQLLKSVGRLLALRRVSLWDFPADPKPLALLWLGGSIALIALAGQDPYWFLSAGTPFAQLGCCILAALLAAWMLGRRSETIRFAFAFMAIGLTFLIVDRLIAGMPAAWQIRTWVLPGAMGWSIAAAMRLILSASGWARMPAKAFASIAVVGILLPSLGWRDLEPRLFTWFMPRENNSGQPDIDHEALWTAQPGLLAAAAGGLTARTNNGPRTFILTVAAGGSQQLFGREAIAAGKALDRHLSGAGRVASISNASVDLMRLPLANRSNLAGLLAEVGKHYDPRRDLMVIYLASHGSQAGELATDLPDYTDLKPISAAFLGKALSEAGIARRIVVVSACYSGTWIKSLANADTIVLTASAADRTSFGCDDRRQVTEFGEAFIGEMIPGRSLGASFDKMKQRLDARETLVGSAHSLPQAFVGTRMERFWEAPR